MLDAYADYKKVAKQEAAQTLFAGTPTPAAPKKLSLLDKIRSDKRYAVPDVDKDGFYVRDADWYLLLRNILDWYLLLRNILTKTACMLTGPSGSGKTELVALAGRKLGMEVNIYNMGTMIDPISGLLGVHRLVQGGSVFDYAKFTEDIQKSSRGRRFLRTTSFSRAWIPGGNSRWISPEAVGCETSRSIRTASSLRRLTSEPSTQGPHKWTAPLSTASSCSRWSTWTPTVRRRSCRNDAGLKAKVLSKRCGIESSEAKIIVETARTVRSLYLKGEVSSSLSTRETLGAGRMVADGWSVLEAMERSFLPFFEGSRTEGERVKEA